MDDRSRVTLSVVAGAVLGGVAGYVGLTGQGRRLYREIQPRVSAWVREYARTHGGSEPPGEAARGWQALLSLVTTLARSAAAQGGSLRGDGPDGPSRPH